MKKIFFVLILFFLFFPVFAAAQETLTWQDCVREAAKNNPGLISAEEAIRQQEAAKGVTASGLYPQIDASLDASTAKTAGTATSSGSTRDTYSYEASGTQLVFDGFKTINDVKSASETVQAARQGYRFASTEVRLNLRTAFINLMKAQALTGVAEQIIRIRKDNLVRVSLRYQSGLEHKGALLTAEANLASAHFDLSQAKRDVVLAQRQLTKEMGRSEFRPMSVGEDFTVRDAAAERPDYEEILKTNPSLLEAVAKKNAASFGIRSAYGNFSPAITASASGGRTSSHWPPENDTWNLGVSLNMPLFEGGLRTAQLRQAKALYNQAQADERSIRDAAIVALEQTWVSLQDSIELVGVAQKILEATQERSRIAEVQYATGFISFDNWIIIEDDLVRAKRGYLDTQANALYAEANWIQAKGETLEYAQ